VTEKLFGIPLIGGHFENTDAYIDYLNGLNILNSSVVYRSQKTEGEGSGRIHYVFWDGPGERKFMTRLYPVEAPHQGISALLTGTVQQAESITARR